MYIEYMKKKRIYLFTKLEMKYKKQKLNMIKATRKNYKHMLRKSV